MAISGIASRNHPVDPIVNADPEDVLEVFATNVLGNIRVTNRFLPLMMVLSNRRHAADGS